MSEQTIQSRDIEISELFQGFYTVPDYQREFVWETGEVEQLLADISAELAGNDPERAPEYFIGSIVVCPAGASVLELIDGQQRMTTLFLTLCALRDRITALGQDPPGALPPQIAATSTDVFGRDLYRYRLELQYEDSGGILEHIAKGLDLDDSLPATRSIANIRNAYKVALSFLRREFADDVAALRVFYGYLTNKVKLIRIQTEDVAKALKIFETINDRGVGLNSMDLLKNLLFMKAERDKFEKLKNLWKDLQDTIFGMGEKPLRFLRYFIFSSYGVEAPLREDEIYGWLAKNDEVCGYGEDPLGFADKLLAAAKAYRDFFNGRDQAGNKLPPLQNLRLLGGKAARQHLILLLAGRHLSKPLFTRLAREVEDLFFVYVITREPTRDFERDFARWAADLRKTTSESGLETFIEQRFARTKAEFSDRFDDALRRLSFDSVQQYRLRYILAKLTQFIELQALGDKEGTKWLGRYIDFEIEHIFPRKPSPKAVEEFGPFEDLQVSGRLGNLVLVEQPINASLGSRAYSEKRPVYAQSQLLLTRALYERPKVGRKTKIDVAVAELEPYAEWNESAVLKRQDQLAALARKVWNVP